MNEKDERLKVMNEVLGGMKVCDAGAIKLEVSGYLHLF